ncbi:MAG: hypothetical protein PVH88_19255 [Ignavibacteria bacterium]
MVLFNNSVIMSQQLFEKFNEDSLNPNTVVAKVGDTEITAEEFFYSYQYGPSFPKRKKSSKETHLKYMINEKLLALEGYKEGVMEDDEINAMFSDIQADIATEEMYKDEVLGRIEIDSAEVDTILQSKMIEVELKWLFSENMDGIKEYYLELQNGVPFDSLFNKQINDSVFVDMRSMKRTVYSIRKNNPPLAQIIDTLKAGVYSPPVHVEDGWYIMKLHNIWRTKIVNQAELDRLKYESEQAAFKFNMDRESDKYIDSLMLAQNSTIKKNAFDFLRAYLGKYILSEDEYEKWDLENKLDTALSNLGLGRGDEYRVIDLVVGNNRVIQLDEFIVWYRNRNLYIKFDKTDLDSFSESLEKLIWRMVRDEILTVLAKDKGYFENSWVQVQSNWWRDKVAYGAMRNKIANSIIIENKEVNPAQEKSTGDNELSDKMTEKMLRTIIKAKQKNKIEINNDVLDKITVSEENNKRAINLYAVKTGGLIPRLPYPTIDKEWESWE